MNSGRIDTIYGAYIGEISGLAINKLGTLIASAASEEMYIKIWDTCRKIKVAEVRRADIATIYWYIISCLYFFKFDKIKM